MSAKIIVVAFIAAAAVALASVGAASDGGSGTYTVIGRTYYFAFFNSGTAPWQYFYLVGPPGTTIVGGGTITEATPRCVVGLPDGRADEIECGPLSANLAAPHAQLGFAATLVEPVACGSAFQLYVSSTGETFTRGNDVTFAGSCDSTPPHAITPPTISGKPIVGRTLVARPAVWSAEPSRVVYLWQLCTKTSCRAIKGATKLRLKLTQVDRGRSVRVVATASIGGASVTARSGKIAVFAAR